MIRKLLGFALNQRMATLALVVCLIGLGIWSWINLKKTAYPDVGDTSVKIITIFPGRAATEVEQQVTLPLERALNGVPKVIERRSKTIFGLSCINLTFEDGTDDYFARQRVLEKLNDAVLPDGVTPSLGPLTGPVDEIFRYVIESSGGQTPMELRTIQDWVIIPKLLQAKGVADVINFGGLVKQYHVITSPNQLLRYNITLQQVIDAIKSNNTNTGGNVVKRGEQSFIVRGVGAIQNIDDILNIIVVSQNGVPILIKNLATVEEYPSPPSGILGYTLKPYDSIKIDNSSSIQGLVAMRRGENPSESIEELKKKVAEINERDLPPGVKLTITYDRSELVNYTIETVSRTLLEGFIIVIIVLIFFIGNVRAALIVATTIPVSLLFAFSLMKFTGIPANLLSLGAIDFGIIVDGAVFMVENIIRRYSGASEQDKKQGIIRFTLTAAQEVGKDIFFSITIIILAYLPIFSFQRVEGKLFSPMAYTLSYAITGSMLLALTAIPVLMTFFFKKQFDSPDSHKIEWHNPLYSALETVYNKTISLFTKHYVLTVLIAFSAVSAMIFVGYKNTGAEFLPELDEGSINIRCFFPVGISLDIAKQYSDKAREIISSNKPVNVVLSQLGRNDDGTDPYGPNRLEILVGLKDYSTWNKIISKKHLLEKIKTDLENNIPGALISFSQPILDNVTEAVTGSVADLAIMINGQDLKLMRAKADTILSIIKTIPGATEYGIEHEGDQAQLSIKFDRQAAARFGVNVSDVQRMIEAAIGGKSVSKLYEGEKLFDIVVRYTPEYRSSLQSIEEMIVLSSTGARIPMSQLATVSLIDGPTVIQRQGGDRQISVRTNIRGRDQSGFVAEAKEKVLKVLSLPKGYSMSWGGVFENLERASGYLVIIIPVTVLIIFLILFTLYKNFSHVLIVMSSIPFAMVGGIVALMLRHYNFTVSAGVGFISLFGISTMTGVLFVSRANRLIEDNDLMLADAVKLAAKTQLRPSLMAILLALLGLIPAALATGIGSDVQRPLATVIVGGLASQLFLTLLVLPSVYYLIEKRKHKNNKIQNQEILDEDKENHDDNEDKS